MHYRMGFSLQDIENMYPFELEIRASLYQESFKKEKEENDKEIQKIIQKSKMNRFKLK